MLNSSITLSAVTGNPTTTFARQWEERDKSQYSVANLAPTEARTMSVSHQTASKGTVRSMIDLTAIDPVSGSTTGATETSRVYLVIQRGANKSASDMVDMVARLCNLLLTNAGVTASANLTAVLNREV